MVAEWSYRETAFRPAAGLTDQYRDEFRPEAAWILRQVSLEWRAPASRHALMVRRTNADFSGRANGYWGGQRYLRLSSGSARLDGWLVAGEARFGRHRTQAEVETSEFQGFGRADIEGWRFDRSNFVGGKRVAEAGAEGTLRRFRLAGETARRWGRLRGALTWYEIRPRAELESWIKIVFTVRDRERHELSSDRYSLAAFSLGGSAELHGLSLSLGLHQFVHFDDHGGRGAGEPEDLVDERPSGWFGGTFLETSVAKEF